MIMTTVVVKGWMKKQQQPKSAILSWNIKCSAPLVRSVLGEIIFAMIIPKKYGGQEFPAYAKAMGLTK